MNITDFWALTHDANAISILLVASSLLYLACQLVQGCVIKPHL